MDGNTLIYIAIAVMVMVLIAMLVVKKTMATSPMLQPVLFLCVAIELGLVGFVVYKNVSGSGNTGRLANYIRREEAKGFAAGKALSGKKILLIMNEGAAESKVNKEGLFKGLKDNGCEIVVAEIKNTAPEGDIMVITYKDVDKVLANHQDAKIIAFYDTFPADYHRISTNGKKDVQYFLFSNGSADMKNIGKDIKDKKIIGIVVPRSNTKIKPSDPVERNLEQAFEKRYILVTAGNLDANKDLFK